jgi:hypothetical protein
VRAAMLEPQKDKAHSLSLLFDPTLHA